MLKAIPIPPKDDKLAFRRRPQPFVVVTLFGAKRWTPAMLGEFGRQLGSMPITDGKHARTVLVHGNSANAVELALDRAQIFNLRCEVVPGLDADDVFDRIIGG